MINIPVYLLKNDLIVDHLKEKMDFFLIFICVCVCVYVFLVCVWTEVLKRWGYFDSFWGNT